ncbi:type 1 glutamine amidotransferase [Telmatospirillum siberiense]|uniref:Glutamine amidotransferase n=1 Tax=Telmatospirillum siberiense TaxID=382514 RepID=A0A2N3PUY4_9PROT|nr:type 1 glutamine amidotransferase [Telmatospirillum siberiense]PKU24219.1 glutamine amidotransferase [Telmatospirillum siberiense]
MLIGILETGRPAPALAGQYGTYADMVEVLLGGDPDLNFHRFWLPEEDCPESASSCDAWVITGSRCSVTEEQPWMLALESLLRKARDAKRPVIGLCFGHQILAKAMGGHVAPAPNGWQLGLKDYELRDRPAWLAKAPERLRLNAIHQDQVLTPPPGATLLANAPACPYAALSYGNWAVSFQAHPEFTVDFEKALLSAYVGVTLPEDSGRAALADLAKPNAATDSPLIAEGLLRFLRQQR